MDALPEFRILNPTTLAEVIAARADNPKAMPLGGGTDLVVNIRRGIVAPPVLIDMNRVQELHAINVPMKKRSNWVPRSPKRNRRAPRDQQVLPRRRAGRRAHRRPHAPQHGHRRRQSLPRHALHLLQSERMVAERQ